MTDSSPPKRTFDLDDVLKLLDAAYEITLRQIEAAEDAERPRPRRPRRPTAHLTLVPPVGSIPS